MLNNPQLIVIKNFNHDSINCWSH